MKSLDEIKGISEKLKREGKRIVTTNGCFDILHPGHVYLLEKAKEKGDVLIVGLNSDESVRANKGEGRPVKDERSRALVLAAFETVDYVVIFREETPIEFIKAVKPDVHCNSSEYGEECVEAEILKEVGAELCLVERVGGWSTTGILGNK